MFSTFLAAGWVFCSLGGAALRAHDGLCTHTVGFYTLAAVATKLAPDPVVNKTTAEHPLLLTFRATANPSVFHDFPLF